MNDLGIKHPLSDLGIKHPWFDPVARLGWLLHFQCVLD